MPLIKGETDINRTCLYQQNNPAKNLLRLDNNTPIHLIGEVQGLWPQSKIKVHVDHAGPLQLQPYASLN